MLRRQDDSPGHHWGRWSLPSAFSVMIGAIILTTFPFLCGVFIANIYFWVKHYGDVIVGAMASQITSLTIVYSTVYSGTDQRNIKAPRHWPLCREFTDDWWIPHKWPVTRKMFAFDDVIMTVYDMVNLLIGHTHVNQIMSRSREFQRNREVLDMFKRGFDCMIFHRVQVTHLCHKTIESIIIASACCLLCIESVFLLIWTFGTNSSDNSMKTQPF